MSTEHKHTPGPWKHDGDIRVTSRSGDICVVLGYGQTRAANVQNACLIAAAPELLAAVETLLDSYSAVVPDDMANGYAMKLAEDAIAKAKGRS